MVLLDTDPKSIFNNVKSQLCERLVASAKMMSQSLMGSIRCTWCIYCLACRFLDVGEASDTDDTSSTHTPRPELPETSTDDFDR